MSRCEYNPKGYCPQLSMCCSVHLTCMQEVAGSIPISPRDTEMRKEKPNVSTRYGTGEHAGSDVIVAAHVGDLVGEHDRTAL